MSFRRIAAEENSCVNNNEDARTHKGDDSLSSDCEEVPCLTFNGPQQLLSDTAAMILADAKAADMEADEATMAFLRSQFQYLGLETIQEMDASSEVSRPLNRKVGRKKTQPKKERTSKKRIRKRERVWDQTSKPKKEENPIVRDVQRIYETMRAEVIQENDVFLQPEGAFDFIEDAVKRQVMKRVTDSMKSVVPNLICEISQLATVINLVLNAPTWRIAMQCMYIYLCPRLAFSPAITKEVMGFVADVFGDAFLTKEDALVNGNEDENGEVPKESNSAVGWLLYVKNIRSNWNHAKEHPLFTNFTKFMSVMCYTGIVSIDKETWTADVADAVMPGVHTICKNSRTMLDSVLDIVEYVAQAAAIYIDTGDLESAIADRDNGGLVYEIARITSNHQKFKVGLLRSEEEPITDDMHYNDLHSLTTRLTRLMNNSKSMVQSNLYSTHLIKVQTMKMEVYAQLEKSPSRIQPWSAYLVGLPGSGKSTLMGILAKACIDALDGEEWDARRIYNRCSTDAYWSKFRADMYGVMFNDVGASLDEAVLKRLYDEMLRVQDVARYYPPMPEAHEKGIPDVNNLFTLASGNSMFPFIGQCVTDLAAYTRRYRLAPVVVAKPEFCTKNAAGGYYIDSDKVDQAREKGTLTGTFDETADIFMHETRPGKTGIEIVPIEVFGKHKLTVTEFITFMVKDFLEHIRAQKRKMAKDKNLAKVEFDSMKYFDTVSPTIPEDKCSSQAEGRFLRSSPVEELVASLGQFEHNSENAPANKRFKKLQGKKGRRHSAVPYDLTPSQVAQAAQYDLDHYYANVDQNLKAEADFAPAETKSHRNYHRIHYHDIHELGGNSESFQRRWSWVPNCRLKKEWLPEWVWNMITPADRGKISQACHQNMCIWSLFSSAVTLGPLALFAPMGLCASLWAVSVGVGNVFLVNAGRKLHGTCLQPSESIYLAANWRQVEVQRIAGVTAVIILACQVFRSARATDEGFVTEATDFEPTPLSDPHYRQLGTNPWNKEKDLVDVGHLAATTQTTVSKDLLSLVQRGTYAGEIWRGHADKEKVGTIMGLVFHMGYMLVAAHYLTKMKKWADTPGNDPNVMYQLVMTRGETKKGAQFTLNVDYRNYFTIADGDIAVLKAVKTGKMRNLIKHFPTHRRSLATSAFCVSRKPREETDVVSVRTTRHRTVNVPDVGSYTGFTYERESHYQGLCGASIISRGAKSHIMGLHTAGSSIKQNLCVASIVTQQDLYDAIDYYTKMDPGTVPLTAEGELNMLEYLKGFQPEKEPHFKSPLRYTTNGAQFSVLGVTPKSNSFRSSAKKTPIADAVGKYCNIDPDIYCAPVEKPSYYGPQLNADAAAVPADDFPDEALRWARNDLWQTLSHVHKHYPHKHGPLNRFEIINGTGRMFEEAMNRDSVWGQPEDGKKSKDMFENKDPSYKPSLDYSGPIWDVNQNIHELMDKFDAAYASGSPTHAVFTSCIKDEIHTKPKARVFEVAPMPITLKGRELTLTTSSFLRLTTEYSECAVGANCHGLDGTFLYDRAVLHGTNRIIAGDFSKYDKRMPTSIGLQSLSIYEQAIREWWDVTDEIREESLKAFHAWTLDVIYPTIDFFGDIIQMRGGYMPSGIPITADKNGLDNSIIHRCVYYLSYVEKHGSADGIPPFRTMVSLLTYGDDSMGSVHPDCDWFNMRIMNEYCARYGMVYTDPEKNDPISMPEFLELEKLDFLKRNFNKIHECGQRLGALTTKSLYKPLCMVLWDNRHTFNMDELAITNMNGSMFEAFNHGKAFYDQHREAMIAVAEECEIPLESLPQVLKTFEERLENWYDQYQPQLEYIQSLSV